MVNVENNDLNEVVSVPVRKCNGELIRRHSIIILLERQPVTVGSGVESDGSQSPASLPRSRRVSAQKCEFVNRNITMLHLV